MSEVVENKEVVDEKKLAEEAKKKNVESSMKVGMTALALFLILIFAGVFMFYASNRSVEQLYFEYNGIEFVPNDVGIGYKMMFYINNAQYPVIMTVRNDPRELEKVPIDIEVVRSMIEKKNQVYITQDPDDNLTGRTTVAAIEIDYFIDNDYLYNIPVNSSLMKAIEGASGGQVIKTCEDAKEGVAVIWLRLGDETAVFEENGCVVVQGTDEMEIIAAADRLYLTMVGIMQ
jgi:hypothetical protein